VAIEAGECEVKWVEEFFVFVAWGWFISYTYHAVMDSRKKARAQVAKLERDGFHVDYMLKGSIYVLVDHSQRKIAFVFADRSFVYDYADIRGLTRNWVSLGGLRFKNGIVFSTRYGRNIRCGNLSSRNAEYWHPRLATLIAG
jgi:hypothetical protein